MFLVHNAQDIDEPSLHFFFFYWNGTHINVLLDNTLLEKNRSLWKMRVIRIPKEMLSQKEQIISDLKEALTVFAYNGKPNFLLNDLVKAEFAF